RSTRERRCRRSRGRSASTTPRARRRSPRACPSHGADRRLSSRGAQTRSRRGSRRRSLAPRRRFHATSSSAAPRTIPRMSTKLWIGSVAYDPKVVTIWEGMRAYFRDEAKLDFDIVLFLSYEAQVEALLASHIDIAWNTNLAFLQSEEWSEGRCVPLGMRDT